jgi:hypothetical protein
MSGALLFSLVLAQALPVESVDSAQLARIRRALDDEPPAIAILAASPVRDGPVFRVTVHGRTPERPIWENWATVPSYIRPSYPLYHNEFLAQVTPEFFRASVLYPGYPTTPYGGVGIGVPLVPLFEAAAKGVAKMNRQRQEASAREEVRQALEDLRNAKDHGPEVRTIIRSGVELRIVAISVLGKNGDPPRKLVEKDFTILEDGVPQAVTQFVKNTDNPGMTRYQLGYAPPPSKPGETRHIEIRIRGIRRQITHEVVTR